MSPLKKKKHYINHFIHNEETLSKLNSATSWPCAVAYTCKPSYLTDGDQEDPSSRPGGVKISKTPISTKKLGMVVTIVIPAM
jgi:hypothetical protein